MKKKFLQLLVLFLAVSAMGLFANGNKEVTTEKVDDGMKWSGKISVAPYMFGPIEKDIITPMVEEVVKGYGYNVELENIYIETSAYHDVLNLRIASNEAPDIFYPGDIGRLYSWYDQGAIAEWDRSFLEKNAPDFVRNWSNNKIVSDKYFDLPWKMGSKDGKMIALPAINADFGPTLNAVYNKQWLDKLGVKELPLSLEDWYALMTRFAKEDPDGNGKDDTYGFSSSGVDIVFGAFGSFPALGGFDFGQFYLRDGKMVSANLWPGNKDALAFLNKAYKDGVLDPEFITGENTGGYWAISQAFVNGKIGYSGRSNIYHWFKAEENSGTPGRIRQEFEAVQGVGADISYAPYPKGPKGWWGYFTRTPVTMVQGICYNADLNDDTEKLAAIFQIMNLFSKDDDLALLEYYGIEGDQYKIEQNNDNSQFITSLLGNAEKNAVGLMALRDLSGPGAPLNENMVVLNNNAPASKLRKEIVSGEQMGGGYVSDIFVALPSETLYNDELKIYRDTTFMKMIIGDLPLSYWDTFVDEYNKIGGAVLTKEANDWYQANK
jgi:putative aldouronate transport system substrate-binding protein